MPTSEKQSQQAAKNPPQRPKSGALFYPDEGRKHGRGDAELHDPIIAEGDHGAAQAVSIAVMERLGFTPEQIETLLPSAKLAKSSADNRQARLAASETLHRTRGDRDVDWIKGPDGKFEGSRPQGGDADGAVERPAKAGGGDKPAHVGPQHKPGASAGPAGAGGAGLLKLTELGKRGGSKFRKAITAAKTASTFGAAVSAYSAAEYNKMRTFLSADGKVGFALNGDDIVSVFRHPDSTAKDVAPTILTMAVENGGRRLDCFDTALPHIYSRAGFKAVARLPFDPQYQPKDWNEKTFADYNSGKPDVVFMVYDPSALPYQAGDGKIVDSYDAGVVEQRAALETVAAGELTPEEPMRSGSHLITTLEPPYRTFEVLVNPTTSTIKDFFNDNDTSLVRVWRDSIKNLYLWDAEKAIHSVAARAILKDNSFIPRVVDTDAWGLVDGELHASYNIDEHNDSASVVKDWISAGQGNVKKAGG